MTLSQRITNLTPGGDDGWGLFREAQALKAQGVPITDLTIGEHDIRTDPAILGAMHEAAVGGHTGYATVPGIPELRQAVADRITERTGVLTGPENVLITAGGQAALFAAHLVVLDAGDKAGFIDPYYATYPGTIRGAGGVPVPVVTGPETRFQPNEASLKGLDEDTRSLLINTPNNPTGVVYDDATLDVISDICRDRDLWLVSDEVYDTQVWDGSHRSPRSLPGMVDRTLVVGSLSKSHAMTGSRLGWLVGPPEAIDHAANLATHTTYGVPGYIQDAGLFALSKGASLENRIAEPFQRRRALALEALDRQNLIRAVPPMGAMYMMLDMRATGLSGADFAQSLLDSHRIAVMPGESFGKAAAGHIRVAMTVADAPFAQAMDTLLAHAQSLA